MLFPKTYEGCITVTPRLGAGFTNYSSVDGPQPIDSTRTLLHAGIEASYKATKVYDGIKLPKLGVDRIRHVFRPLSLIPL